MAMPESVHIRVDDQEDQVTGPPSWLVTVVGVLIVASLILSGIGLVIPLAELDVETTVGAFPFVLESEFTQSTVDYSGSAPEFNITVGNEVTYLTGTGEYQERVGFLKGTAKQRTNVIKPWTDPTQRYAELNVTVRTETIPWWVVGVDVPCEVEVELVEWQNVSELSVNRVYLEFRRLEDGNVKRLLAWERGVDDEMEEVGQRRTYSTELSVSEDWGEFQLFGMINVTMKDVDGTEAVHVLKSWSDTPKTITLWTIPTGQGIVIGLLIVAMPVTVVGVVLCLVALALVLLRRRRQLTIAAAGTIVLFLGALFFQLGLSELVEVFGYPEYLDFLAGFWVAMIAVLPVAAVTGLLAWTEMRWPSEDDEGEPEEGPRDESQSGDVRGKPIKEPMDINGEEESAPDVSEEVEP